MNHKKIIFSLFIYFTIIGANTQESGVFNRRSSRLGDNIAGVTQAMWLSYTYNIPYYYQWFVYSDQFKLHEQDTTPDTELKKQFTNQIYLKDASSLQLDKKILYMTNVFSNIDIEWQDKSFVESIKNAFSPRYNIQPISVLPKNKTLIALHIRMGGGFDKLHTRKRFPSRFPNLQYYIDQLHKMVELLSNQSLHVHIFTDDQNPNRLKQLFEQQFKNENITFSCRQADNRHDKNVVEDFFAMMNFDILIRSGSLYSYYAWRFGDQKIMICPKKMGIFNEQTGYWSVEEVEIIERD